MTKLEELTVVMVNEIDQFKKSVNKLEKIQKQKIGINSTSFEFLMRDHQERLQKELVTHRQQMKSLGFALGKAKAYPMWALIIFAGSLIFNGIFIFYHLRLLFS